MRANCILRDVRFPEAGQGFLLYRKLGWIPTVQEYLVKDHGRCDTCFA